ncbi:ubiquitin-protein ligase peroxin 12 [Ptychographa xylographoides]|nr:ubiquitin-protein ligase peroxin 12 [Ptychographa xylographoides]
MEFMSRLQNGLDDQKPSLFELLSEQQLAALLPPSIRYLLVLATQRHPRYLLRILNSFDELYALLMLAVERHYLLTYGGGFTENFYGLKRERVPNVKGGELPRAQMAVPNLVRETLKLRTIDVWKNLVIMVGLPYLKRKLDESYEIHAPQAMIVGPTYNRNTLPSDATIRQRILHYYKWFLRNVYPSMNAAYYLSLVAFNLAYLFDNTKYSSPFLFMIGTRIRRLGEADYRAIALAAQPPVPSPKSPGARPGQTTSIFSPRIFATTIVPNLFSSLKILLPTSIFALKFLEWWHASDFARQLSRKATEGLNLPPPIISGLPYPTSKSKPSVSSSPSTNPSSAPGVSVLNTVSLSSTTPSFTPIHPTSNANPSILETPIRTPKPSPPISTTSHLPILTVPPPTAQSSSLCPICLNPVQTPTAAQTGYVFCYTCIFKWVNGSHERQLAWMEGNGGEEGWGEDEGEDDEDERREHGTEKPDGHNDGAQVDRGRRANRSREGKWESGKGRCAVTGRRLLGGSEGLRRVMV